MCRADWGAFASIWNAIVEDLRSTDLISNTERDRLSFQFFVPCDQVGAPPISWLGAVTS